MKAPTKLKRYISWSGGKDSGASIGVCYEKGIDCDGVVMSEVMFDHKRGISGENPQHIEWVYNTAIPNIERLGYKVIIVKDKSDYLQEFNHRITKSKDHPERVGKKAGFFVGGMCAGNSRLKMRPLRNFFRTIGECEQIIGIAADEIERQARATMNNKRSVLVDYSITESMTYGICEKYGILSPIYNDRSRGGCWFCPNQSPAEFAALKKNYPHLFEELKILSRDKELASNGFRYEKTFAELEKEIDAINRQITIFDLIGGV